MEESLARDLSRKLKISVDRIVREYWEMIVLKELSQSDLGDFLVFGGGTALRLAYGSPRFSDDMDFCLRRKTSFSLFSSTIKNIEKKYDLKITDLYNKRFTFLAELKIDVNYLSLPFLIKIEARKKIVKNGYEPRLLISPTVNFQVLFYVFSLERIKRLKIKALKDRKEPRDLFDLWFICQKLKNPFKKPKVKIEKKFLKQTLNKYLPLDFQKAVDELIK